VLWLNILPEFAIEHARSPNYLDFIKKRRHIIDGGCKR